MGRFVRSFCSAAIVGVAAAFTWNKLLDDRAKASLKRCASSSASLTNHFVATYMDSDAQASTPGAAEQNRKWVAEQWERMGY